MVKLIRLVGADAKEIRNHLTDAIKINPYSKIALLNCSVEFSDSIIQESFTVDANNDTFDLTVNGATGTVELVNANPTTFTLSDFLIELTTAMNWASYTFFNMTYQAGLIGDYFTIIGHKYELEQANFNTTWDILSGDPLLNSISKFDANGSVDAVVIRSKYTASKTRAEFRSQVQGASIGSAAKDIRIGLVDPDDASNTIIIGFGIVYTAPISGAPKSVLVAVENGVDIEYGDSGFVAGNFVSFIYEGAGVWKIKAFSAAGNVRPESQYTGTALTRAQGALAKKWVIKTPAAGTCALGTGTGSLKTGCTFTMGSDTKLTDNGLLGSQAFVSTINIPAASKLKKYLGFPDGTATATGDPAILTGKNILDGDTSVPGVLVNYNNSVLASYDGETGRTSNILAVINEFVKYQKAVSYAASFPVKIGLNNANEKDLNDFVLSFTDQENGKQLEFSGKAVVTALIYDEFE